jgi:hypothetical protein
MIYLLSDNLGKPLGRIRHRRSEWTQRASLMALAEDVRFTRLSLAIEGIEGLPQPLFGGFTGVDGAANSSGHGFLTPKNRGPDHRVPVISRAILDRLE